jgi:hypothetical protein
MTSRYYPSLGKDKAHPEVAQAVRKAFDHLYTLIDQVQALQTQVGVVRPLTADQLAQVQAAIPAVTLPTTLVTRVTTLPPAQLSHDGQQVIYQGKVYWFDGTLQAWTALA